jgi:hypothetical protein
MAVFSEQRLDIEACNAASMLDRLPVKKKEVEDQGGKWMRVLLPTKQRGATSG